MPLIRELSFCKYKINISTTQEKFHLFLYSSVSLLSSNVKISFISYSKKKEISHVFAHGISLYINLLSSLLSPSLVLLLKAKIYFI